jgi:mRNA interferase MazF
MPGNVRVSKRDSGLPRHSVVNVTQLLVVDRSRLRDHAGTIPGGKMKEVDEGLRLVLGL